MIALFSIISLYTPDIPMDQFLNITFWIFICVEILFIYLEVKSDRKKRM